MASKDKLVLGNLVVETEPIPCHEDWPRGQLCTAQSKAEWLAWGSLNQQARVYF
jgi:hypothetical protein